MLLRGGRQLDTIVVVWKMMSIIIISRIVGILQNTVRGRWKVVVVCLKNISTNIATIMQNITTTITVVTIWVVIVLKHGALVVDAIIFGITIKMLLLLMVVEWASRNSGRTFGPDVFDGFSLQDALPLWR